VHTDIGSLRTPYVQLAQRLGFRFLRAAPTFSARTLTSWHQQRRVSVADEALSFDFLVLATGAAPASLKAGRLHLQQPGNVLDLVRLRSEGALPEVTRMLQETSPRDRAITIVGAGPTGMQFLFELDDHLRARREDCLIHLVNTDTRLLPALPDTFHHCVVEKIASRGGSIWPHLGQRFLIQDEKKATWRDEKTGEIQHHDSQLTILAGGVVPQPLALDTNRYGQVMLGGSLLPAIFAAGDCAHYAGGGLNAMTAQAAVRKGKLVAENIRRLHGGEAPAAYDYHALGYFLSLGPLDGVGWLGSPQTVLSGASAFVIKSAVEKQFQLFMRGVDTYTA
jgi:NADH dehydrogenase